MKKFLAPLLALVLLGAGCAPTTPSNLSTEPTPEASSQQPEADKTPTIVIEGSAGGSVTAEVEPPALPVLKVDMRSGNFFFEPKTIAASAGQQIEATFGANEGFHTFVIDEINFKQTVKQDGVLTFTAPVVPGSYPIYCDVGSHRERGMEAMLIVK
jgi:plastocyanin